MKGVRADAEHDRGIVAWKAAVWGGLLKGVAAYPAAVLVLSGIPLPLRDALPRLDGDLGR